MSYLPRQRWLLSAIGLLAGACLVGKLEINPNYDQSSGGALDSAGGAPGSAGAPPAGEEPVSGGKADGAGAGEGGHTAAQQDDGGSAATEAGAGATAGADSGMGGMPSQKPTCEYSEQHDGTNRRASPDETGFAESTGLKLDHELVLCGTLDVNHYESNKDLVDVDSFALDVQDAQELLVTVETLQAPPTSGLLELVASPAGGTDWRTIATPAGRSALWRTLASAQIVVSVVLRGPSVPTAPIPYVIRVRPDDANKRCPKLTPATADKAYTEKADGPSSTGNDTIRVNLANATQVPTTSTTDAPEAVGATLNEGSRIAIDASSGNVAANVNYRDIDAFAFAGGTASLVTFRIDWQGAVDFDTFLFRAGEYRPVAMNVDTTQGSSFVSVAADAAPGFWFLTALYANDASELPKPYSVSVCGEAF